MPFSTATPTMRSVLYILAEILVVEHNPIFARSLVNLLRYDPDFSLWFLSKRNLLSSSSFKVHFVVSHATNLPHSHIPDFSLAADSLQRRQ
jgi:hypothetical protein